MSFTGGYIFKHFEGAAEPVLRDFPVPEGTSPPPSGGHQRKPWLLDRFELMELFRQTGGDTLLAVREDGAAIRHVIVAAVHNSPLNQMWKPGMSGDSGLFDSGVRTLGALFPNAALTVAINRRDAAWFERNIPRDSAAVRIMSDRYPQELPELLIRDIAGSANAREALVVSFEDVVQTAGCLCAGRPPASRIVPVAGPGVSRPGWYRIPLGTAFADIRQQLFKSDGHGPWRVIRGNLFTGTTLASGAETLSVNDREITVIREHAVRDFQRFLNPGFDYDSYSRLTLSSFVPLLKRRLDSNVHGGTRPCVQCNFCDEVCPVGLYPHFIWKQVTAGMTGECARFRPERCVGCGLCDYVCPSKIPLAAAVRSAATLREAGGE